MIFKEKSANSSKRSFRKIKIASIVVLVVIMLIVSFGSGLYLAGSNDVMKNFAKEEVVFLGKVTGKYNKAPDGKLSQDVNFDLFWKVWDLLESSYVDKSKLNEKTMLYGAIKGMVSSVGDPYTVFMDPKISQDFSNDLAGTFEGIGAEVGMKADGITIVAPLPDMPAEKAGLKAGDRIIAIDGKTTSGLSVDEAVKQIRGPKGTDVKLTIYRKEFDQPKDFVIKRDKIVVKSVNAKMRDDKIYLIEISNFNDDTQVLFDQAISKAVELSPKGIILDLRNNPGGYLETAIEMASEWVEEGPVVSEQSADGKQTPFLARGRARAKNIPTVVLVNQGSASASEIVAGALQDAKEATIIGMQTFGKGSVQNLENLPDGSSVKITIAKWLTPNGTSINDTGIKPDIQIDLTADDFNNSKDPQFQAAVDVLNGKKVKSTYSASSTPETATSTKK